jgi:hypothetical protein
VVLDGKEWRHLIDTIPTDTVRDRALIAPLTYGFARVGAALDVLLATFLVQPDQPAVPLDCRSSTRILSAAPTRAKP